MLPGLPPHLLALFTKVCHMFWQLNWPELWIVKRNKTNLRHGGLGGWRGGCSNPLLRSSQSASHPLLSSTHTTHTLIQHPPPPPPPPPPPLPPLIQHSTPYISSAAPVLHQSTLCSGSFLNQIQFLRTASLWMLFSLAPSILSVPIPIVPIPTGPIVPIRFIDCKVEKQEMV